MATCGGSASGPTCYINNDSPLPFSGSVKITAIDFKSGKETELVTKQVSMPAGVGQTEYFTLSTAVSGNSTMLHAVVTDTSGAVVNNNYIPFTAPKNMALPKANVKLTVAQSANPDGTVDITVTSDAVAVYVTLTTLAQGRFDTNAFVMAPGTKVVKFIPIVGMFKMDELTSSLRVEHAASYM